jgi:hypothetical protein
LLLFGVNFTFIHIIYLSCGHLILIGKIMVMGPAQLRPVSDCAAKYRPILMSERVPHFKNQAIVSLKKRKKENMVMGSKGVPDTKTDWLTDRWS